MESRDGVIDVKVNASPAEADAAILFFSPKRQTTDEFHKLLRAYGYAGIRIKSLDLSSGYTLADVPDNRPLLIIVDPYWESFSLAIIENIMRLAGKRIYVRPPAGSGSIVSNAEKLIARISGLAEPLTKAGISFLISLPDSNAGKEAIRRILVPRHLSSAASATEPDPPASPTPPQKAPIRGASNAGLISDAEENIDRLTGQSVDHLDIGKDVQAFARVIAARSFKPPLAIALFGKWGSGKSFFMRLLQQKIVDLSARNPRNGYCEGVVHIRFNAWSYLDANLWASLMSRIFEGLYGYIHDNAPEAQVKKLGGELKKQLNTSRAEVAGLESKKSSIHDQLTQLETKKGKLDEDIKGKIASIRKETALDAIKKADDEFKVRDKIGEELGKNKSFGVTAAELKAIVPEKYWDNPASAYAEARSNYTFFREFIRKGKIGWNIVIAVAIIAGIILIPLAVQLFSEKLRVSNFALPQVLLSLLTAGGVLWRQAEKTYNRLQPIVASFWKIKEDYEKKRKEALAQFEQKEKALNLEIEKARSELVVVEEQIQQNKVLQAQLDFKLDNALSTDALYSFIEKRSQSDDYSKYLGVISMIRKDFEMLSYLFAGHNAEMGRIQKMVELKEQFKQTFDKPLERIVLYIDDLDRCSEENVVQVLEAVNLLMAFPLFVVVVGVDLTWVKNALIKRHYSQFTGRVSEITGGEPGLESVDPVSYLEKIFQIPFYLKSANDGYVRHMLSELASSRPVTSPESAQAAEDQPEPAATEEDLETYGTIGEHEDWDGIETPDEEELPALELEAFEIIMIADMAAIIGSNPRAIKRFVNSYRIVRCHEDFTYFDDDNRPRELAGVLFLLALPIGVFRRLFRDFESYITNDKFNEQIFSDYVEYTSGGGHENAKILLRERLLHIKTYDLLKGMPIRILLKQRDFVGRFTFRPV